MTITHLATPAGDNLCWTPAQQPHVTAQLDGATCTRCLRELDNSIQRDDAAWLERTRLAAVEDAARQTGTEHVWAFLRSRDEGTPTDRMLREVFGSLVIGLAEMGCSNAAPRAS